MQKLLKIHQDSNQFDFEKIWSEALFVFDSNVLLDLYRLPKSARDDLIRIFENEGFKDRIWIGFQVIIEFLNNRYSAISDQKGKFSDVKSKLQIALEKYDDLTSTLLKDLNKLQLRKRHSVIDPDRYINTDNIQNGVLYISNFIKELKQLEKNQPDVCDYDLLKDLVIKIFEGKIGPGFDKKGLQSIYKDGKERYENKFPPGYKDSGKEGRYFYEDKEYVRKYGDLILWKEIIEKTKAEKLKFVVLVTGDVKEDWWFERRGQKLGPRKELLNEIYTEAPDLETFYMYDTSTFMQYAKSSMGLNIQDSSISEAKDLIELSREEREHFEEGYIDIAEFLLQSSQGFDVKVGIGKSVKSLPPIKLDPRTIYPAITEIFSNVLHHSSNKFVGVQAKKNNGMVSIRFINIKKKTDYGIREVKFGHLKEEEYRGYGLYSMRTTLQKKNIDIHISEDEKRFIVELFIPINDED